MMKAISTITWPGIVAPVVGPTLGGFITTYASWHWVFFLNVPFGILALWAIAAYVPNQRSGERRPLDLAGFVLSGASLIALLYGTELASHQDASMTSAAGFIAGGLIVGGFAVRHFRKTRNPLLNLTTLRVPTYAASVLWGSTTRIGVEAVPYLAPLLFQIGFGLSAFQSGLLLLATACGNLGMKMFTTPILRAFGFRTVAICAGAAAAGFAAAYGWLSPATPLAASVVVLFGYGVSRSMQYTTLATLAYADIEDAQKSSASTLWSVAQQMTLALGIAFGALCLRLSASLGHGGPDPSSGRFAPSDFRWAFIAAGAVIALSIIGYVRLPRDAGNAIAARA